MRFLNGMDATGTDAAATFTMEFSHFEKKSER
jgi:hypothetical protein